MPAPPPGQLNRFLDDPEYMMRIMDETPLTPKRWSPYQLRPPPIVRKPKLPKPGEEDDEKERKFKFKDPYHR